MERSTGEQLNPQKGKPSLFRRIVRIALIGIIILFIISIVVGNSEAKKKSQELLAKGQAQIAAGQYDLAVQTLQEAQSHKRSEEIQTALSEATRMDKSKQAFDAGINALETKNYEEAMNKFQDVIPGDKNYSIAQTNIQMAKQELASAKLAQAQSLYKEKKYIEAYSFLNDSLRLAPDNPKAQALQSNYFAAKEAMAQKEAEEQAKKERQAKIDNLKYYEGRDVQLAISDYQVIGRKVAFYASVWNRASQKHHANPNNFTLVDNEGFTYAYDTATFEYSNSFPAVDLQPDTKAGGAIVFMLERGRKPSKIIYEGLFGGRAEKILP